MADREKKWNAFQADPEWIAKRAETIGRPIEGERLAAVVAGFKQRADQIGEINDAELIAIIDRVDGVCVQQEEVYAAAG